MEYGQRSRKNVTLFKKMLIGEICRKSALSKDTVRYYEKRGLITVKGSNSKFNNYKEYSEENLHRLMLIKKSKRFGFTLNEIFDILELVDNNRATCSMFREKVTEKLLDIDQRIKELEDMKSLIYRSVKEAQNNCREANNNENCRKFAN